MKRNVKTIICVLAVALMIASVAFAAQKMKITAKELPGLKGTWEGMLDFGLGGSATSVAAKLEILNDTVPVKAKMTLSNVPDDVARLMGVSPGTNTFESDEGAVTTMGTLYWTSATKSFFEVAMGDKKLNATYWFKGVRGSATLKKK